MIADYYIIHKITTDLERVHNIAILYGRHLPHGQCIVIAVFLPIGIPSINAIVIAFCVISIYPGM